MPTISPAIPFLALAASSILVFAAGWRICSTQNAAAGAIAALLFFVLHPAFLTGIHSSASWDAAFAMLFVTAWLWMEHWSLFMRSWVLALIFSLGLWIGSPFVLWGLIAMVPWVLFNRRPLAGIVSLLTVLLGGLAIFALTWGATWLVFPALGRPLFSAWVKWSGVLLPPAMSLPWLLMCSGVVIDRLSAMVRERRSDASIFAAVLLVVTGLLASPTSQLVLVALSSPLMAHPLIKKEFLFHRKVRWMVSLSFLGVLGLAILTSRSGWVVAGPVMLVVAAGSVLIRRKPSLSPLMAAQAVCVGAYLAEAVPALLRR